MNKIKFVLPVLLLSNLLCMMDVSIVTIVLPEIQSAFHESFSNLSWVLNIYTIIFATLIIPFGRLAQKFGRNKFVFVGLLVFGLGSLLSGLSNDLSFMLFARTVQSAGAAMIIPTSMVIALEISNQSNRNKIVAALAGAQGLAVALGPTVGGILSQYGSWRWVFFINIPLLILDIIFFVLVLPMKNEQKSPSPVDFIGAFISMLMLFSLSFGLIQVNKWGWTSPAILSFLALSFFSFIAFIFFELRQAHPMINMSLFQNRNFNGAGLSLVLCNFLLAGMVVLIPTFLTRIHGQSELNAALLITPYSVTVMFAVILTSLFVKKINNKMIIAMGFVLLAASYYMLANLDLRENYYQLIIADILLGIGYGMVAATANILAVADFHGDRLTDSQSVANVLRQVGMVLSFAVITTMVSANISKAKNDSLDHADQYLQQLDLPARTRNKIDYKINKKLDPKSSQMDSRQEVKVKKIKVSQRIRTKLKEQAFRKQMLRLAQKSSLPTVSLPLNVQARIKRDVDVKADQKINDSQRYINRQLNAFVTDLKSNLKDNLNHAFLDVYKNLLWLPLLSILTIFIYKFKKE